MSIPILVLTAMTETLVGAGWAILELRRLRRSGARQRS